MLNNQIYHKNYTEFGEPYQLVLPLNLEGLIPDDDSVRLLSHEQEKLDYSLLYQAYSAKDRNPAVCGCLPGRKLPTTARSPVSAPVSWRAPAEIFSIRCSAWRKAVSCQNEL